MRNRYSKEYEDFVRENASKYKKEELRLLLQEKFNIDLSIEALRKYLYRHRIRCVDYCLNNVRDVNKSPIGTEYVKSDGMILVKVEQPDKWEYKHRLMYMKYHNCKLDENDFIIFLNQDRNDFSKENLKRITRRESAVMANNEMFSKNEKLTDLGILTAKLMIKSKEVIKSDF